MKFSLVFETRAALVGSSPGSNPEARDPYCGDGATDWLARLITSKPSGAIPDAATRLRRVRGMTAKVKKNARLKTYWSAVAIEKGKNRSRRRS